MSKQHKSSRETMISRQKNMYLDSVKQWNVFVGCKYNCFYCKPSFQRQMKRQKQRCEQCYNYKPHFHEERLKQKFPKTKDSEFVWVASSSDISFIERMQMHQILLRIVDFPETTFFFQSKQPLIFAEFDFPENCVLGITLETDIDDGYHLISDAPYPTDRFLDFLDVIEQDKGKHKYIVTIEPILKFNLNTFVSMLRRLHLYAIYIGYDTKKCGLSEPFLQETLNLIKRLKQFTQVREKLIYRPDLVQNRVNLDNFRRGSD